MSVEGPNWNDEHVRSAVLELLKEMNQSTLAKQSPLSQPMISNILNSKHTGKIGSEKCREFGAWYLRYREENPPDGFDSCPKDGRLTFHPLYEIPNLRHWYQTWKNPSDIILRQLVDELNSGPVRKERAPVTLHKLKMWWKNEKQRLKRIQAQGGTPPRTRIKQSKESNQNIGNEDSNMEEESGKLLDISVNNIPRIVETHNITDPMFSSTLNISPEKINSSTNQQHQNLNSNSKQSVCAINQSKGTNVSHQKLNESPSPSRLAAINQPPLTSRSESSPEQYFHPRVVPQKIELGASPALPDRSPPIFAIPPSHHLQVASRAAGIYNIPSGAHAGIYSSYLPQQAHTGLPVFPNPELRLRSPSNTPSPRGERL